MKVGCCGFPGGMRSYFSRFEIVEVQQTFYQPPRMETALRWRREAPADFEFAIKAWQLITHPPSSPTYRRARVEIGRDFIFVWEPRGVWNDELVRELCKELDLVHCVDPTLRTPFYGRMRYFRLHGGPGYRHVHTDEELERLKGVVGEGETYFMFNNLNMCDDALRLRNMIGYG